MGSGPLADQSTTKRDNRNSFCGRNPLQLPGIYVRNVLSNSPAAMCGCIRVGDRILAVNGKTIVGADYLR